MKPKDVTLKDLADAEAEGTILGRNLDVSEEILTRAAKVAYEIIDNLAPVTFSPEAIVDSALLICLVEEFVTVLSSGK